MFAHSSVFKHRVVHSLLSILAGVLLSRGNMSQKKYFIPHICWCSFFQCLMLMDVPFIKNILFADTHLCLYYGSLSVLL